MTKKRRILFLLAALMLVINLWSSQNLTPAASYNAYVAQTPLANMVTVSQNNDGHYYGTVLINDVPVRMLIDTGASQVTLSRKTAQNAGFDASDANFTQAVNGITGEVRAANWTIPQLSIGSIVLQNVAAVVIDSNSAPSLLGMSVLNRMQQVSLQQGQMILHH